MAAPQSEKQNKAAGIAQAAGASKAPAGPQGAGGAGPAAAWRGYVQSLDAGKAEGKAPAPAPEQTQVGGGAAGGAQRAAGQPEMNGIASNLQLGRFVGAAREVEKQWGTLTPETRAAKLGNAACAELSALGVPAPTLKVDDLGAANGQLQATTWTLALGKGPLSVPSIKLFQAAEVANTVYHEARHAEQFHRMARLLAGQGKSAGAIARAMSIPARVAADAAQKPLVGDGPEAKEAAAWYESVYGGGGKARNEVIAKIYTLRTELDAATEADAKAAPADKAATGAKLREVRARWDENYAKYRALPEEADAWAVGGKVKSVYRQQAQRA